MTTKFGLVGVPCPKCGGKKSKVIDSRGYAYGAFRRRHCECGDRFTTVEIAAPEGVKYRNIDDVSTKGLALLLEEMEEFLDRMKIMEQALRSIKREIVK